MAANSAPLTTNFNVDPYYDDYDETKNFHRILYKPGFAVQARELTQMQTIGQKQIQRFGDNVYQEGTIIDGCEGQYDRKVAFVKLRDNDPGGNTISVAAFANGIVTGLTSNVRAQVIATAAGSEAGDPDLNTIFVKYLNSGRSNTDKTFRVNETISFKPEDGGNGEQANTVSGGFGFGTLFSVNDGIVYGKGNFVRVEPQTVVLSKYDTTPSQRVSFNVEEDIVTFTGDESLLDPAEGAFNFTAPGADRLKLTAVLRTDPLTASNTFVGAVPIFEVENGIIKQVSEETVHNELGRQLAVRTFEESGNYMVRHINVDVKEHLDTGENFGRFNNRTVPVGDKDKLAVGVEPGVAYVMGYRVEIPETIYQTIDKATTTDVETGLVVSPNYGNYINVNQVAGPWDPTAFTTVSLRDTVALAFDSNNMGGGAAPGSEIGTANLRFFEYDSGDAGLGSAQYKAYLFNIKITADGNSFANTRSIYINNASGPDSFADVVLTNGSAVLNDQDFNKLVFDTGIKAINRLRTAANTVNATYTYRDKQDVSFASSGVGSISMGGAHAGGIEELSFGVGALNDTQKDTIQVVNLNVAATTNNSGNVSIEAANTIVTGLVGASLNTEYRAGDFIQFANTTGTTAVSRITSANSTALVVTPAPSTTQPSVNHQKVFPSGYIFDLTADGTDGTERTATVVSTTSMTIDLKEDFTGSVQTKIFFNARRENGSPQRKVVRKNRYVKIDTSTNAAGTAGPWNLGISDVFGIRNVYRGSTYSTTNRNVTEKYLLNRNSNDSFYDHSKLLINSNNPDTIGSGDKLLVELDYFEHDRSTGIGYLSKDSYIIDPNESTANTTAIATPQIPIFNGATGRYDLRDSVDFRPIITNTAADSTTIGGATENPGTSTTLDVDSDGSYVPVQGQNFTSDIEYFLPRKDRVVLTKDGRRVIVAGVPSEKPVTPLEPAETLTIATLDIAPFPSLSLQNANRFGRIDQAVRIRPVFQKTYKMSEIAALEKRIDNLEYYTALNVLEKAATDLQIPDENGLNRFKNGIFVDSFFGFNNANLNDPNLNVSIDKARGEIRPKFESENIDIEFNPSAGTNITRTGDHAILTVSSSAGFSIGDIVFQGSSLGAASAAGTIRSSASSKLILHNANGTFTTGTLNNDTAGGTTTVSTAVNPTPGPLVTLPYNHTTYIRQPSASQLINPVGELSFIWKGELTLNPEADHWSDHETQPDVQWDLDLAQNWQTLETAWGTQWGEWQNQGEPEVNRTSQLGGSIFGEDSPTQQGGFGSSVARNLGGGASLNTQVETNVEIIRETQRQTREGTRLNVRPFERTQTSGPFLTRTDIVPFMRSRRIEFTATGLRPNTELFAFFDRVPVSNFITPAGGNRGDRIITDDQGNVSGFFDLPNNDSLRFRLGERTLMFIDIDNLDIFGGTETTSASTTYTALGLSGTQKGISFTTREASLGFDTVTQSRTDTAITDVNVNTVVGVEAPEIPDVSDFITADDLPDTTGFLTADDLGDFVRNENDGSTTDNDNTPGQASITITGPSSLSGDNEGTYIITSSGLDTGTTIQIQTNLTPAGSGASLSPSQVTIDSSGRSGHFLAGSLSDEYSGVLRLTAFVSGRRSVIDQRDITITAGQVEEEGAVTLSGVENTLVLDNIEVAQVHTGVTPGITIDVNVRNDESDGGGGNRGDADYDDPLAQTFTVGSFEYDQSQRLRSPFGFRAEGIFLTGIDLFFQQVGTIAQGVAVEIREVSGGQITTNRVPFGYKRILTSEVNVSEDGTVPTPFYFDSPVYLRGGAEYAFVVRPDGNDQGFRMWIAQLGSTDVSTGDLITQQPASGMLFTSANDLTYVPRQNQDVKFTLYRAQFQDVTGTMFLNNQSDEYLNIDQITRTPFRTGETIRGECIIELSSNTAALSINDFVTFGANTGQIRKLVSNTGPVFKADLRGDFKAGANIVFSNASGSYSGIVSSFTANTTTGSVELFKRVNRLLIANNSSGNFTSNTTDSDGFYRGQSTYASCQVTGVRQFKYNVLTPRISFAQYGGTRVIWDVKTTDNTFNIDSDFTSIEAGSDNVFYDEEKVIAGRTGEVNNTSGNKTLQIRGTLSSTLSRISPVIDVGLTKGVIATHNIINNLNTNEHLDNGDANVKYISKQVVLADGQDAEDIKVVISAYKPPGTDVDVYARIKSGDDEESLLDKHYTKLTQETATSLSSSITNKDDFFEIEYGFPSANATSLGAFNDSDNSDIVTYRNSANSVFTTYKSYQIKIVLRSSAGSQLFPTVKDLRAIALQI